MKFLVVIDLNNENGVTRYVRPAWYLQAGLTVREDDMNLSTLADQTADLVLDIDPSEAGLIDLVIANGGVELSEDQYEMLTLYKTIHNSKIASQGQLGNEPEPEGI